jgi:hypothetical protein
MAAGLALLLAGLLGCSDPTATRQIATPPKITSHWQAAPHLAQELAAPLFAPSNPLVAYELPAPSANGNGAAHDFQRTDDGGATWQAISPPQTPGPLMNAAFRVSPLDAHNVFLQVDFGVPLNGDGSLTCPGPLASRGRPFGGRFLLAPRSNTGNCPALFYSTDGGDHWVPSHLPMPGDLVYANESWPMTNTTVPREQGGRLYAELQLAPNGASPLGVRYMVSADHGATWQLADTALFTQAPAICTEVATQQGTSLFALTADTNCFDSSDRARTLWRSDDNGATWIQEGPLPAPAQQLFATGGGGGPQPLLYAITLDQSGNPTLSGIQVSANSGHTWQAAPLAGAPATRSLYQIAGMLSDGSLVAAMLPSTPLTQPPTTYTITLYALKAGAAAWRQLSPPSPPLGQPGSLLVAPGGGASTPDTIWVVSLTGNFQQPGATYATEELITA